MVLTLILAPFVLFFRSPTGNNFELHIVQVIKSGEPSSMLMDTILFLDLQTKIKSKVYISLSSETVADCGGYLWGRQGREF